MFSLNPPLVKVKTDGDVSYHTSGSACFDIPINEDYTLAPHILHNYTTGLSVELPDGWCLLVFLRSSIGQKMCIIPNSVGVIDSDYRGEIKIPLINLSDNPIPFFKGQRIAQGLVTLAPQARLLKVSSLSSSERGIGGFGSTGS